MAGSVTNVSVTGAGVSLRFEGCRCSSLPPPDPASDFSSHVSLGTTETPSGVEEREAGGSRS